MKKLGFLLRKIFVSFEFLVIVFTWYIYTRYIDDWDRLIQDNSINLANSGFITMSMSVGMFVWLMREGKVLGGDLKGYKKLLEWDYYWKLKYLFYISISYGCLGLLMCAVAYHVFPRQAGIHTLLIVSGNLILLIPVMSCYFANLNLKEIMTLNTREKEE